MTAPPHDEAPEDHEQRDADADLDRHRQVRSGQEPLAEPADHQPGRRPRRDLDGRPRLRAPDICEREMYNVTFYPVVLENEVTRAQDMPSSIRCGRSAA